LEGLGILWIGRTQKRVGTAVAGTAVLMLAAASAWRAWTDGMDTPTFLMVMTTIALTWHAAAWLWRREREASYYRAVSPLMLAGGVVAWLVLLVGASTRLTATDKQALAVWLAAMTLSAVLWSAIGRRLAWKA